MRSASNLFTVWMTLGVVGLSAAVAAQQSGGNAEARKIKNPVPTSAASVASGQQLYQKFCRHCHGAEAKGDGPMAPKDSHPPNLTDETWDHGSTDGEIFVVIRDGSGPKNQMKGYNSRMTPQEMWNVVNYVRSLGSKGKSD